MNSVWLRANTTLSFGYVALKNRDLFWDGREAFFSNQNSCFCLHFSSDSPSFLVTKNIYRPPSTNAHNLTTHTNILQRESLLPYCRDSWTILAPHLNLPAEGRTPISVGTPSPSTRRGTPSPSAQPRQGVAACSGPQYKLQGIQRQTWLSPQGVFRLYFPLITSGQLWGDIFNHVYRSKTNRNYDIIRTSRGTLISPPSH